MKSKTDLFLEAWIESRTRFSNQLENINSEDLQKKLGNSPNSVGFLIRHIGDVELLFAKNVFGDSTVKVSAKTVFETIITTKEFGTKTKSEAFGRIVSHTAYHAGQIALIKKYGETFSK